MCGTCLTSFGENEKDVAKTHCRALQILCAPEGVQTCTRQLMLMWSHTPPDADGADDCVLMVACGLAVRHDAHEPSAAALACACTNEQAT